MGSNDLPPYAPTTPEANRPRLTCVTTVPTPVIRPPGPVHGRPAAVRGPRARRTRVPPPSAGRTATAGSARGPGAAGFASESAAARPSSARPASDSCRVWAPWTRSGSPHHRARTARPNPRRTPGPGLPVPVFSVTPDPPNPIPPPAPETAVGRLAGVLPGGVRGLGTAARVVAHAHAAGGRRRRRRRPRRPDGRVRTWGARGHLRGGKRESPSQLPPPTGRHASDRRRPFLAGEHPSRPDTGRKQPLRRPPLSPTAHLRNPLHPARAHTGQARSSAAAPNRRSSPTMGVCWK